MGAPPTGVLPWQVPHLLSTIAFTSHGRWTSAAGVGTVPVPASLTACVLLAGIDDLGGLTAVGLVDAVRLAVALIALAGRGSRLVASSEKAGGEQTGRRRSQAKNSFQHGDLLLAQSSRGRPELYGLRSRRCPWHTLPDSFK